MNVPVNLFQSSIAFIPAVPIVAVIVKNTTCCPILSGKQGGIRSDLLCF